MANLISVEEQEIKVYIGESGPQGPAGVVQSVVAGTNVTVDNSDPANPIISASGGGGGGGAVDSVNGQTGVVVLDQDDIADGSTYKQYSNTEKTKLAGIETSADVTDAGNVGSSIHGSSAKTTPVDADTIPLIDSASSNVLKKVTWANIKATAKAYFDTLYASITHNHDDRYYTESETDTLLTGKANTSHTHAQSDITNLTTDLSNKQPLDSDLTAIAGLSPSNDDVIQRKSGAWINRTIAQLKADFSLSKSDVGLSNVDNTSDANKPVSTATQTALNLKANDSAVVHITGDETIAGLKTFSSDVSVPDEVYGSGWNGSLEVPTKNALYDKIETLSGGSSEPVKSPLSGSSNGKAIKVSATSTPGTTIHTAPSGTGTTDLVTLMVQNNNADGETRTLTLEFGGTSSPDDLIILPVPCKSGLVPIMENLPINNSLVIRAFSDETNDIQIMGHKYAQTDWLPLSGSSNGRGIKVTGNSSSSDVTIHTAVNNTTEIDEIVLYAQNNNASGVTRTLTIANGAETDPDNLIILPLPAESGLVEISSKEFPLLLNNSSVIGAWADVANEVVIFGSYRRRTL